MVVATDAVAAMIGQSILLSANQQAAPDEVLVQSNALHE